MKKLRKQKKKEGANKKNKGKRNVDFSAIHLLNDPDGERDFLILISLLLLRDRNNVF